MARISFFAKTKIITYSELLYLKLNGELLDEAQKKIYSLHTASESDLTTVEKINAVINALTMPRTPELDMSFKMMMQMAIYQTMQMQRVTCAPLRLSMQNYETVKYLIQALVKSLPQTESTPIGIKKKTNYDEKISIIINSILILFRNYDVNNGTMTYIGMDINGKK